MEFLPSFKQPALYLSSQNKPITNKLTETLGIPLSIMSYMISNSRPIAQGHDLHRPHENTTTVRTKTRHSFYDSYNESKKFFHML